MKMESQQSTEVADLNSSVLVQNSNRQAESPPTIVTVRMVVDGKEVGSIIGKKGDNVKRYRESSGAKINISDASCAERIVTITGMLEQIRIAFNLMCIKFEDDLRANTSPGSTLPPVNVKLVIPASQCGSLIGKGGTKIKELREVASDMLPGSTERVVTITGGATSISNCVTEVCSIMLESPPKGATIPYRPKPAVQTPMMYGMTAAYGIAGQAPGIAGQPPALPGQGPTLAGQPAVAMPPQLAATMSTPVSSHPQMSSSEAVKLMAQQTSPVFSQAGMLTPQAMAGLPGQHALGQLSQQGAPLILPPAVGASLNPYAILQPGLGVPTMNAMNAYLAAGGRPLNMLGAIPAQQQNQSTEMVIPNELIGCIIGRGGAKINEIRQLSGAQIKISNCEEGTNDRKVTITGYPDTISMATYLINTSVEIHKAQLLMASQEQASTTNHPTVAAVPSNLTPSSVSSQSNSQPQLTSSLVATVSNTAQLQQLQKQASQVNGQATINSFPYNLSAALPTGYSLTAPQYGLTAYDPKSMLAAANKLKILPAPTGMKLEQRFTPY